MRKIISFFAFVAIVISFAACGGNVPEIKDFTFKVYVLNTRAHITVTPLDNKKPYYWSYVRADELNGQTLQAYVEAYFSKYSFITSMGEEKADLILPRVNTTYILWACYVEQLEGGQLKIIGDIVSQEITTLAWGFLQQNEFSFGPNKPAFFSNCNYIKGIDYDYEQWTYYGRTSSTEELFNPQDLFTWTEMDQASGDVGFSLPNADHWWYLFKERKNADERFTLATIHVDDWWRDEQDIHGLIILPDDWQTPDNVTLKTAKELGLVWNEANNAYEAASSFDGYAQNVFNNTTEWWALEEAGAVFLPAAGANAGSVNSSGYYWSSSESEEDNTKAFGFMFNKYRLSLDRLIYPLDKTQYSYSVRPVEFIENIIISNH